MFIQPYLYLEGRCEEALEFYRGALGAQVTMLMRWKDCPEPQQPGMLPPGSENKVMHAEFRIGDSVILASDGKSQGRPTFQGFALALSTSTDAETDRLFGALADGGQVLQPLTSTFFTSRFGMLVDRFGVAWTLLTDVPATE
jgi:PhnB protein